MFDSLTMNLVLLAQQAGEAAEKATTTTPWYQTGGAVFVSLLVLLFLSWFFGARLAKSFRMPEYRTRIGVIIATVLFSTLIVTTNWPPRFGVDLRGGMNMIGSLNFDNTDPNAEKVTAQDIIPNLNRRIDPSGTKEIQIRALGDDKIEVTMPAVDALEADEIWNRLVRAGLLQFRITADRRHSTDEAVMERARKETEAGSGSRFVEDEIDGKKVRLARWVGIAREDVSEQKTKVDILPFKYTPGPQHLVRDSRTLQIIDMSQIGFSNNRDRHGREFAKWCAENNIRKPQILVLAPESEKSNVEGKHLSSIRADMDEYGRSCVSFNLNTEGGRRMGYFTQMNLERDLGIVLDGQLHSAPTIQDPIYDRGRITGQFTSAEIQDLIISLRSGKLDVALNKNPISKQFIESALGAELKQKGLWAIGVSLILVLIFMMFYYRFAGIVATFALVVNLMMILCLIMAIQQPLTLTGLAGLVLTVGMSVDANVLIFERIREEIDRGSALRMAIRNGFDKATTTIVDANVTTLITALVLYIIGTEQIKGFAVTLILGILMSMFTAIYCSRAVFDIAERRRYITSFAIMRLMSATKLDFLGKRFIAGFASIVLIVVGLVSVFYLGAKMLDHDLRGGSTARIVFDQAQEVEDVRDALDAFDMKVNEEAIEFTVSKLRDDEYVDRVFKVDSNLPTWDGEGESTYDDLSAVLGKVFAGKLSKLHVDFKLQPPADNPVSILNQEPAFIVTSMKSARPSLLQDVDESKKQGETVQQGDTKKADPPAEPTISAAPPQNQDETSDPTQDPPVAGSEQTGGGDFPAQAPVTPNKVSKTTASLTFAHDITGQSIKTLLSEAANRMELTLDEEQIDVISPEMKEDDYDSVGSFPSKNWTVTMELGNDEDAARVLASWATNFNTEPYFPTSSGVGGQIARDTQLQALGAIIASLLGIIAYVWIRFQNVAFGLAAVIALIHDVLIVLGAIAVSHFAANSLGFLGIENFKISLPIIAALLTIIGYSLNDTIVVFDRIREVRGKRTEITADMINTSISQTLSRTILTSVTTFIVVFILYCFGGDAIHGFAFSLVIGVIVGTYSSIFVASPALLWLMNTVGLNPGSAIEEVAKGN